MDVVEKFCPSRCKIWITTVQLESALLAQFTGTTINAIYSNIHKSGCVSTLVCLTLTLRYMKILEVAAAMCKGHLGEKCWGKANAEWGIPVKPRAESEIQSSLAIQPPIFNPSWKEEEICCCLILSYVSFHWSLTPVTSFWWGKKLSLVTPGCHRCALVLETAGLLLKAGKMDKFYNCTCNNASILDRRAQLTHYRSPSMTSEYVLWWNKH